MKTYTVLVEMSSLVGVDAENEDAAKASAEDVFFSNPRSADDITSTVMHVSDLEE